MADQYGGVLPGGEGGDLGGLSQDELNKRILHAMLAQGSSRYDQMLLTDTLGRSRGPTPLGPRGRGMAGELNDFMTAYRPGAERAQALEMVKQLRMKDEAMMAKILAGGASGSAPRSPTAALNTPLPGGPPSGGTPGLAPGVGLQQPQGPALGLQNRPPRNPYDLQDGMQTPELYDPYAMG